MKSLIPAKAFLLSQILLVGLILSSCSQNNSPDAQPNVGSSTSDTACDCESNCLYYDAVVPDSEITVIDTLYYGTAPNWALTTGAETPLYLSLHVPDQRLSGGRPLWVNVHGGGFRSKPDQCQISGLPPLNDCQTNHATAQSSPVPNMGYVYANLGYRLGWDSTMGDPNHQYNPSNRTGQFVAEYQAVQDLLSALAFLTSDSIATQYGIDPNQVYLHGSSAGGVCILMAAFYDSTIVDSFFAQFPYIQDGQLGRINRHHFDLNRIKGVAPIAGSIVDVSLLENRDIPLYFASGTCDVVAGYHEQTGYYWANGDSVQDTSFADRIMADSLWAWGRPYGFTSLYRGSHVLIGAQGELATEISTRRAAQIFRKEIFGCNIETYETWVLPNTDTKCNLNEGLTALIQPFPIYPGPSVGEMYADNQHLIWESVPYADQYLVQVATDPGFSTLVQVDSMQVKVREEPSPEELKIAFTASGNGPFYWRVQPQYLRENGTGINGVWSNTVQFTQK